MNVGAKSITDYGLYFQWGETQGYTSGQVGTGEGKKKFSSDYSDYKWDIHFTKYYSGDSKTVLDLEDDAVNKAWGGSWRMPTMDEFDKLGKAVSDGKVSSAFTTYTNSNVEGLLLTDKADENKKLFSLRVILLSMEELTTYTLVSIGRIRSRALMKTDSLTT